MELNAEQIIKALECCRYGGRCAKCPCFEIPNCQALANDNALALIKQLTEEKKHLEYTLLGVMHSVDKWLDGAELEQDEVNRAAKMREKTLQIVEQLTKENESLKAENEQWRSDWSENQKQWEIAYDTQEGAVRADTAREMQERIKTRCIKSGIYPAIVARAIDQIAKEMLEGEG